MYENVYYDKDGKAFHREITDDLEKSIDLAPVGCVGIIVHEAKTGKFITTI